MAGCLFDSSLIVQTLIAEEPFGQSGELPNMSGEIPYDGLETCLNRVVPGIFSAKVVKFLRGAHSV